MAAVKSRNTKPELLVRRLVHSLGYRFRLHRRDLPGTPDIVLTKFRKIINVHGCFWHMHTCRHARLAPATNADYWQKKRLGNAARDRRSTVATQARWLAGTHYLGMPDPRHSETQCADLRISCHNPAALQTHLASEL